MSTTNPYPVTNGYHSLNLKQRLIHRTGITLDSIKHWLFDHDYGDLIENLSELSTAYYPGTSPSKQVKYQQLDDVELLYVEDQQQPVADTDIIKTIFRLSGADGDMLPDDQPKFTDFLTQHLGPVTIAQ